MAVEFVGPGRYAGVHEDVLLGVLLFIFVAWLPVRGGSGTGVEIEPGADPGPRSDRTPARVPSRTGITGVTRPPRRPADT